MYTLCFSEGNAGRCGLECRGFIERECSIVDEMVYNFPISWAQFEEARETYPYLEGTKMQHINDVLVETIKRNSLELNMLLAVQSVPWDNLKKDEPVYISDSLYSFCAGKADLAHFAGVTSNGFCTFSAGRTSLTSTGSGTYKFCLPYDVYKKLLKMYE